MSACLLVVVVGDVWWLTRILADRAVHLLAVLRVRTVVASALPVLVAPAASTVVASALPVLVAPAASTSAGAPTSTAVTTSGVITSALLVPAVVPSAARAAVIIGAIATAICSTTVVPAIFAFSTLAGLTLLTGLTLVTIFPTFAFSFSFSLPLAFTFVTLALVVGVLELLLDEGDGSLHSVRVVLGVVPRLSSSSAILFIPVRIFGVIVTAVVVHSIRHRLMRRLSKHFRCRLV